jgi:hypothetical protein
MRLWIGQCSADIDVCLWLAGAGVLNQKPGARHDSGFKNPHYVEMGEGGVENPCYKTDDERKEK